VCMCAYVYVRKLHRCICVYCVHVHVCVYICRSWNLYRLCKQSHLPHVFPQKSPIISGSFAERALQLKASYVSSPGSASGHVCHMYMSHVSHIHMSHISHMYFPRGSIGHIYRSYVCNQGISTGSAISHVCRMYISHVSHIHMSHVSHIHMSHVSHMSVTVTTSSD